MTVPTPPITWKKARDFSDRDGQPIVAIVIHATAGTDSLGWLSGNPKGTSIHILIRKDGSCVQMVEDRYAAHHVGFSKLVHNNVTYSATSRHSCNAVTLGIELENLNDGNDPYPDVQLRSAAYWVERWQREHGPIKLLMHRDIDQHGKADARGIEVRDITKFIDSSVNPPPAPSGGSDITPDAPILAAPRATVDQAIAYMATRRTHPSYTKADHSLIANYYWLSASMVGIDPVMAFAQMLHETGNLTSWWSLRQRRNPAGIGVTGETSRAKKQPALDWAFDDAAKLWRKGHSFASWDIAIKAHLGHLLVYALPENQLTLAQRQMIVFDPRASVVPASSRGCVTWRGLNGKWAVPGTTYADRIVAIANAIKG